MKKIILSQKWRLICYFIFLIGTAILGTLFSFMMAFIINTAMQKDAEKLLLVLLQAVITLVLCQIVQYIGSLMKNCIVREWNIRLRKSVFEKILQMDISKFEEKNSASYINQLTSDCELIDEYYFENLFSLFDAIVQFVVVAAAVIITSPFVFLIMIILTFFTIIFMNAGGKKLQTVSRDYAQSKENYCTFVKENLSNYTLIKMFHIGGKIQAAHDEINADAREKEYQQKNIYLRKNIVAQLSGLGSTLVIMGVSACLALKNIVSVGFVVVAGELVGKIIYPVTILPSIIMNFQSAKPMMERLKVLEDTTEMQKGENRIADINSIVFKNVSFQYVDDHENVIKNISYEFLKGKKYLIVGKSGCGKSTFLRLIAKCFSSYEGEILVNGKEQKEYLESDLYKLIGFMTQNIFLLNDSLKQNLTLYEEYEEKDIRASLKQAGFDNPDKIFKDGLETQISEAGNNFSGGEKQRIALARLLLHKFSWLLFDEFTSNLDAKVADTIESQLLNIHDATVITVSHRLNKKMMQSYDEIIVMDDGEIVEFGSYDSLMQKRGQFYTLAIRNNV